MLHATKSCLWWSWLLLLLLQVPGCEQEEGALGGQGHAQQEVGIQVRGCGVAGRQQHAMYAEAAVKLVESLVFARQTHLPVVGPCGSTELCLAVGSASSPPFV